MKPKDQQVSDLPKLAAPARRALAERGLSFAADKIVKRST
jgi:hypothetical protein